MQGKIVSINNALFGFANIVYEVYENGVALHRQASVVVSKEDAAQCALDDFISVAVSKQ